MNGEPAPQTQTASGRLPVSEDTLGRDGTIEWRNGLSVEDRLEHQEHVTVRSVAADYPNTLTMDTEVARTILASGEPANAEVELPLRLDVQDGKEIVRGSDGLAQAIVERPIATFTLDRAGV